MNIKEFDQNLDRMKNKAIGQILKLFPDAEPTIKGSIMKIIQDTITISTTRLECSTCGRPASSNILIDMKLRNGTEIICRECSTTRNAAAAVLADNLQSAQEQLAIMKKPAQLKNKTETFGQVLKASRMQLKMTCRELAEKIGSTIGYISDLEHDRESIPVFSGVEALEEALGIDDGRLKALVSREPGAPTAWRESA